MNVRWPSVLREKLSSSVSRCRSPLAHRFQTPPRPWAGSLLQHCRGRLREASTTSNLAPGSQGASKGFKNAVYLTCGTVFLASGYYAVTDVRFTFHQWPVVPMLRAVYRDAEEGHAAAIAMLRTLYAFGLHPRERGDSDASGDLQVKVSFAHSLLG
jgi:dihydroorotate dehydrogenase